MVYRIEIKYIIYIKKEKVVRYGDDYFDNLGIKKKHGVNLGIVNVKKSLVEISTSCDLIKSALSLKTQTQSSTSQPRRQVNQPSPVYISYNTQNENHKMKN